MASVWETWDYKAEGAHSNGTKNQANDGCYYIWNPFIYGNNPSVGGFSSNREILLKLIQPIVFGGILAVFLNVSVNIMESGLTHLFRKAPKPPLSKTTHIVSFILTLLCGEADWIPHGWKPSGSN